MSVQAVIFSKDRAMQLHGVLASFVARCMDAAEACIAVIYKASSSEYAAGYEQLRRDFSGRLDVEWVEESHFKRDLIGLVTGEKRWWRRLLGLVPLDKAGGLLFMVDDNLFIREFQLRATLEALERFPRSIGFSLRIGKNTTYCYSNRCDQPLPDFEHAADGVLRFQWPGQVGDFGYPLEVSSSVYRAKDLVGLLSNLPYANPNRLEQGLSLSSKLYARTRPELLCFEQSVAFCAPVNIVQSVLDNRAGSAEKHSITNLNRKFLEGWRIDVEALNGFVPHAAHQEIELPLCRAERLA
jgi:hypothetical protein